MVTTAARLSKFVQPVALFLGLFCVAAAALAHSTERGLIMLLPTGYYVAGGAAAVAATFILLALAPQSLLQHAQDRSVALFTIPNISPFWPSLFSFALLCVLLVAGFYGATDPLRNPLPLFVWTLWWVGFTILQCVTGNLWTHLNPWSGPVALLRRNSSTAPFKLPESLGYLPALVVFFGFAWFELIYPAPEDPGRLATVVVAYWCFVFVGILLFGERTWFARAEPFSIFFRLIGACSPFVREVQTKEDGRSCTRLRLSWPGVNFLDLPTLPWSGVLFVLLTLSSVSFDGFSRTFTWLSFIQVNPLEYPGRSAIIVANTLGLAGTWLLLSGLFLLCVLLGCRLAQAPGTYARACGTLVYAIIPISLVFHAAHYMILLLTNVQYAAQAFNDPFAKGWNLLGLRHYHVTTSFLNNIESITVIWTAQTFIIVFGHVMAIVVAHILATRLVGSVAAATRSQSFLAVFMILYTVFGLWLLSTASIG